MSKYGEVARLAAGRARSGAEPRQAWDEAAAAVFRDQGPSRDKNCPRSAFLGLAEDGLLVGVPSGQYTQSRLNKRYAINGVKVLRRSPSLADNPSELWRCVMRAEDDRHKTHNDQMYVVVALWQSGDIVRSS